MKVDGLDLDEFECRGGGDHSWSWHVDSEGSGKDASNWRCSHCGIDGHANPECSPRHKRDRDELLEAFAKDSHRALVRFVAIEREAGEIKDLERALSITPQAVTDVARHDLASRSSALAGKRAEVFRGVRWLLDCYAKLGVED